MKSLLSLTAVLATLATLAATGSVSAQTGAAGGSARAAGTSVAVVDVSYVFQHHTRFKQKIQGVQKDVEKFEEFIRGEKDKIRKAAEELRNYEPGTDAYKRLEQEMARMNSEAQVQAQLKRKEFMEREAQLYYDAYMEISHEVEEFASRNGIGLVLRFSSTDIDPKNRASVQQGVQRAVVYQRNLNITEFIVDRLNQGVAPADTPGAQANQNNRPYIPGRPTTR